MRLLKVVGRGIILVGDGGGGGGGRSGGGGVIPPTGARSLKHTPPNIRRNMCIVPVGFLTPRIPIASQIHVAILLHKWNLQGPQCMYVVMQGGVGVPGREEAGAVGV